MSIDNPGVPEKGWFFQLGSTPQESKVWHNGQLVKNVTRVVFEIDAAKRSVPRVQVDLVGLPSEDLKTNLTSAVAEEHVTVLTIPNLLDGYKARTQLRFTEMDHEFSPRPGDKSVTLQHVAQWLLANAYENPDHDIVMFFGSHARAIETSIVSGENVGEIWYEYFKFHLPDGSIVQWSPDNGWLSEPEETVRALWHLVLHGR